MHVATETKTTERELRVAFVKNVVTPYNLAWFEAISSRPRVSLELFCADHSPASSLELVHDDFDETTVVPTFHLPFGIQIQELPWRRLLSDFDVIVVMGSVRFLSGVGLATVLRTLDRPVVLAAHAFPHGELGLPSRLRLAWWRMFDSLLVYTDEEAERLVELGFDPEQVLGKNNGLDLDVIDDAADNWTSERLEAFRDEHKLGDGPILLSCARLVAKNEFERVVDILPELTERLEGVRWVVIGDGPARDALQRRVENSEVEDRVTFTGAIYDEARLAGWFQLADLLVHPGAIGLTLLHAFSYRLPVVTHDDVDRHGPEIAALEDGVNGLLFRYGDERDFRQHVIALLEEDGIRTSMGAAARKIVEEQYNVEVMADRFLEACRRAIEARVPGSATEYEVFST